MLARRRGKNGRGAADGRGTFVLGVGAQKAGTTWLYNYMRQSPNFVHGYRKEYHVFDAIDLPQQQGVLKRQVAQAERAMNYMVEGRDRRASHIHRVAMCANTKFYFDYFSGMLATHDGAHLTADVTPDYGMLRAERFEMIRNEFADRQVRVAPTMLMRDPVERIYSTLRMMERQNAGSFAGTPEQALADLHHRPNFALRTRYDHTIEALDSVFAPGEVFYAFYEDFFRPAEIKRFCRFAGIRFHRPDLAVRHNASPRTDDALPVATRRTVAAHYGTVYAFAAARFGRERVLRLWPNARLVL